MTPDAYRVAMGRAAATSQGFNKRVPARNVGGSREEAPRPRRV